MTLQLNNPFKLYTAILAAIIFCILFFRFCKSEPVKVVMPNVTKEEKKQDSVIKVIEYRDSIRTKLIVRWRTKTDTVTIENMHEIVSLCDTIIIVDSTEISSLKNLHSIDSLIIQKQGLALFNDSLLITKLNKKLKRQRFITKLAFITGLGAGGAIGIKLH